VIALGTVWYGLLRPRDEPKYQGRYLSEWVAICYDQAVYVPGGLREENEARNAVLTIGTNALPHFLEWVRYETSPWQSTLRRNLPMWIQDNKVVDNWLGEAGMRRAAYGWLGINLLGTNAVSAIPTLAATLRDRTNSVTLSRATSALAAVGEVAVPALKAAFADTNTQNRWYVLHSVCELTRKLGHTNSTGPILIAAVHGREPGMRYEAEQCLQEVHARTLTNALTE
jgi:hypothetical protein